MAQLTNEEIEEFEQQIAFQKQEEAEKVPQITENNNKTISLENFLKNLNLTSFFVFVHEKNCCQRLRWESQSNGL